MTQGMPQQLPPGWYVPEYQPGLLRYWDGVQWDPTVPPQPAMPAVAMAQRAYPGTGHVSSGLQTMGWLCAFFFPIAGFVIGCMCIAKGPEKDGWAMTIVSGVVGVAGLVVLANAMESATSTVYYY